MARSGVVRQSDRWNRRFVDVRNADRERLLGGQAAGVTRADADRVRALGLVIEAGLGLERSADDLEAGVVGVAGAGDKGVGEGVAGVGVGCGERADGGADGRVLGDRGGGEEDVGGGGVSRRRRRDCVTREGEWLAADRDGEHLEAGAAVCNEGVASVGRQCDVL